jgi:hypothetical protein
MDNRLKEALEYSNYRLTLATYKKNILLRAEAIQLVSESGGMFKSTENLILWVDYLARSNISQYVVIDINDQPILIKDLASFKDKLVDAHAKSMNLLHSETEKIKKARTVDKIVTAPKEVEISDESAGSSEINT